MDRTYFRYNSIEEVRATLADYIFELDLRKKVLKKLETLSGRVVNVKFSKQLQDKFPGISSYLNDTNTEKIIVLTRWNDAQRTSEQFNVRLVSKGYHDPEWPRFDLETAIKMNGISHFEDVILKLDEQLKSGHWERYFEMRTKFEEDYKAIKAMEG